MLETNNADGDSDIIVTADTTFGAGNKAWQLTRVGYLDHVVRVDNIACPTGTFDAYLLFNETISLNSRFLATDTGFLECMALAVDYLRKLP